MTFYTCMKVYRIIQPIGAVSILLLVLTCYDIVIFKGSCDFVDNRSVTTFVLISVGFDPTQNALDQQSVRDTGLDRLFFSFNMVHLKFFAPKLFQQLSGWTSSSIKHRQIKKLICWHFLPLC